MNDFITLAFGRVSNPCVDAFTLRTRPMWVVQGSATAALQGISVPAGALSNPANAAAGGRHDRDDYATKQHDKGPPQAVLLT